MVPSSGAARAGGSPARQVEVFSRLLAAVRRSSHYQQAGLPPLPQPMDIDAIATVLAQAPLLDVDEVVRNRERFHNPALRPAASMLAADRVITVPNGWRARLGLPLDAVTGTAGALVEFAKRFQRGEEWLPLRCRRVIVQTPPAAPPLGDADREALWYAFELPVFEHLVGLEGERLGFECDAHQGFHLDETEGFFESDQGRLVVTSFAALRYPVLRLRTEWNGFIQQDVCACGEPGARFLIAQPLAFHRPAAAGAP
jgi:hypothetical protein